jgi:hypothetical protein
MNANEKQAQTPELLTIEVPLDGFSPEDGQPLQRLTGG